MSLVNKISSRLKYKGFMYSSAERAYDLLASQYDQDEDNLLLQLDEDMLGQILENVSLKNKVIADVGCGTGRHWQKLFSTEPAQLLGFDVSGGMLKVLKRKYPAARTYKLKTENRLRELDDAVCDVVLSTLAIGYIRDIETALSEWCRVLKDDGELIITDYHPAMLSKGANRTFIYNGAPLPVRNYIHSIDRIISILQKQDMHRINLHEKKLGEPEKPYYIRKNALAVFEKFQGMPIVYGLHLKKGHVVS